MLFPILVSVFFMAASPQHAMPQRECVQKTAVLLDKIKSMVAANPTFEVTIYTDERAKKVVAAINADPPPTNWSADKVVVLKDDEDDSQPVLILLLTKDCLSVSPQAVPAANWRNILRNALGDPS